MASGNRFLIWLIAGLALLAAACSSSSSTSTTHTVVTVVQDLTEDADGIVTVVTFSAAPGALTPANFDTDGAQAPVTVVTAGATATVTWDSIVSPTDQMRVIGKSNVHAGFKPITTSDATVPTFVISAGTQVAGLGGDTFTVTFTGPRLIEVEAENIANWALDVGGAIMDLTGSTFALDPATQIMSVTTGPDANLHATFTLAATNLTSVASVALSTAPVMGTASGDAVQPTLTAVTQNITEDGFGRVVDFDFDEAMDPVFSTSLANFVVNDHANATGVTLTTMVEMPTATRLRATFSSCVIPGLDTVTITGLMDVHGNVLPGGLQAVVAEAPPPAANAYTSITATTVANEGGDTIVVVTDQALDPDLAVDPTRWTLNAGAVAPVDMSMQTMTYDFLTRTLTIELNFDMDDADVIDLTGGGAGMMFDVDGDVFAVNDASETASGDALAPSIMSVVQNRTLDPTGKTIDVTWSEDLDPVEAEMAGNWTLTGGLTVLNASLLVSDARIVRLTADGPATPLDVTMTTPALIEDLASIMIAGAIGPVAITSSDMNAPTVSNITGNCIEGAVNDTIVVDFNDDMVSTGVTDDANWTIESPIGTPFDVTGAGFVYDGILRRATITLTSATQNLKNGDDIGVALITMRDIGGNTVSAGQVAGTITSESTLPMAHTAWYDPITTDEVTIRFSEPCDLLNDMFHPTTNVDGTRYALRQLVAPGTPLYPITATPIDGGLGVTLAYGFVVNPTDTIDVMGATDLAGNYMFPAMAMALVVEDATAPILDPGSVVTGTVGENNDNIVVEFNVPMSPWMLLDPSQFTIEQTGAGPALDLSSATFVQTAADQVTIDLNGGTSSSDVQTAIDYDITLNVSGTNPLRSAQGIPIGVPNVDTITPMGDAAGPTSGATTAVFDTMNMDEVLVIFEEAIDETVLELTPANFVADGPNVATMVELLSPRVARVTLSMDAMVGHMLTIQLASVTDIAGNAAPGNIVVALTSDVTVPLLQTVTATSTANVGGDFVVVTFNEQLDLITALDRTNYTVTNGSALDLSGATLSWDSTVESVTIHMEDGVEIDTTLALTVAVSAVEDVAGNALGTVNLPGTIGGDIATAPMLDSAFVNVRESVLGRTIDVLFTEDVDTTYAGDEANWTASGGQTVMSASMISGRQVRLTLDAALAPADTVDILNLEDLAKNLAAMITVDPEE
jgi:hypothetical protein